MRTAPPYASIARSLAAGLCLLALLASPVPSLAQSVEWVSFQAAGVQPTSFQMRRAKARGVELKATPGDRLDGQLTRPAGTGPHPALVLLHGCDGMQPFLDDWAAIFANWGYIVLQVDSYGRRKVAETCTNVNRRDFIDQVYDAYGAHDFLVSRGDVDPKRIGVVGWSIGASRTLVLLQATGIRQHFSQVFRAGAAFYPDCLAVSGRFAEPLLIFAGGRDDWAPSHRCQALSRRRQGDALPVTLKVFPDAWHFFDNPAHGDRFYDATADNREKSPARGATYGYSPAAHETARAMLQAFLDKHLK